MSKVGEDVVKCPPLIDVSFGDDAGGAARPLDAAFNGKGHSRVER